MTLGLALAATGATAILATERFGAGPAFASGPTRVIVDTDIEGDVDDVGALAEVNHMVDLGQANLLAVTVDTSAPWGPQAVDAIDTYYGHDVPIGQLQGASFDPVDSPANYTEALAEEFPRARSGVAVEEAVSLLRRTLAAQPNGSVVIVGIGFLGNLSALLQSGPDAYSPLSGSALVAQKVGRLALMGGYYRRAPMASTGDTTRSPPATSSTAGPAASCSAAWAGASGRERVWRPRSLSPIR